MRTRTGLVFVLVAALAAIGVVWVLKPFAVNAPPVPEKSEGAIAPSPQSPPAVLEKLEGAIGPAKSLRVRFKRSRVRGSEKVIGEGVLQIKGDRFSFRYSEPGPASTPNGEVIICDGAALLQMSSGRIVQQRQAQSGLSNWIAGGFARKGVYGSVHTSLESRGTNVGGEDPRKEYAASALHVQAASSEGMPTLKMVVSNAIGIKSEVAVLYDPSTYSMKRFIEVNEKLGATVEETYDEFHYGCELADSDFLIPPRK